MTEKIWKSSRSKPITGIDEVGIYNFAEKLSKQTDCSRLEWLQRIAAAIIDTHKLHFYHITLIKMEQQGLAALKSLIKKQHHHEPESLSRELSTVAIEKAQLKSWLLKEYNLNFDGEQSVSPPSKDDMQEKYRLYADTLRNNGMSRKQIITGLFSEFQETGITDRQISMAMGEEGNDNQRSSVNKTTRKLRNQQ